MCLTASRPHSRRRCRHQNNTWRSILIEIYLRHVCSCQAIEGGNTPQVRRSRLKRDASLSLRADLIDHWFDELDADDSGCLEGNEIKQLLKRMGEETDDDDVAHAMLEMDPSGTPGRVHTHR
eukprot:COSAG01_NODE_876_length_12963_cov_5.315454_5_plen_122_part_00